MKKVIRIVLLILLLGIFGFSAWKVWGIWQEYRAGEKVYTQMGQYISLPEPTETTAVTQPQPVDPKVEASEPQQLPTESEEPADTVWPVVDFDALKEINSDVVGWIYIPDTNVNYPIVQGWNNDMYLHRLMTGEYNSAGSIFLDAQVSADFSAQNNPIYGHNMKNGSMFAGIMEYRDQSFYDAHPVALLMTPEGNYTVRIFASYETDAWDDSWNTEFTEAEFASWLNRLQRRTYIATDVRPNTQDRILTFSTCAYDMADARFLVHGILEEAKE